MVVLPHWEPPPEVHRTPCLRLHKPTRQAVVRLSGRDVYCGTYGTPDARARYDRAVAEWLARGRTAPQFPKPLQGLTVAQLLAAYRVHRLEYYRGPDGKLTDEPDRIGLAVPPCASSSG